MCHCAGHCDGLGVMAELVFYNNTKVFSFLLA